jgi:hypothetical protein
MIVNIRITPTHALKKPRNSAPGRFSFAKSPAADVFLQGFFIRRASFTQAA